MFVIAVSKWNYTLVQFS